MFANFWWLCHFWQLFVTFVILLFYCPVMMSSCHIVIFTSCHSVLLSSCQSGILSICQFVNFPASELLSLRTFRVAHLRACELVLHIIMISFGGFLAECLPCYMPSVPGPTLISPSEFPFISSPPLNTCQRHRTVSENRTPVLKHVSAQWEWDSGKVIAIRRDCSYNNISHFLWSTVGVKFLLMSNQNKNQL